MPFPISSFRDLPPIDFARFTSDDNIRITFSQLGEDIIVHHLLANVLKRTTRGFYVDIGAHHPRALSNTMALHMAGWRGINVDANAEAIALFKRERPNDINICCGIAAESGSRTFYRFAVAAVGTFDPMQVEKIEREHGWRPIEQVAMPVRSINSLLDEHLPKRTHIDYLNIDTEGLDGAIVMDLDFTKYAPSILSVELHDADIRNLKDDPVVAFVTAKGYELAAICHVTFVFVKAP